MAFRALNDTVVIEPDVEMIPVDDDQNVLDVANGKLIIIPDRNMMMKIPNTARIVTYGPKCSYKFKIGQKIWYDQFKANPWLELEGKRLRLVPYHHIIAADEEL